MIALRPLFLTRRQLAGLLGAVFVVNYLETQLEELGKTGGSYALSYRIAQAFQEMEGGFSFAGAEQVSRWVVGGFTVSYFFVLPALLVGATIACWRRPTVGVLRVFSFAVALNYLMAVPFFLFMPVLERWAFPGAKAVLMSDFLSTSLIEMVRPISGLDNCFPSMHVALAAQVILLVYWGGSPWRHSVACLAALVMLSTFFLGIHWLPDVAMGLATAGLSFAWAVQLNRRWYREETPPLVTRAPVPTGTRPPMRTPAPFPYTRPATAKSVFISYRREGGSRLARVVQMELERRGHACFLDVDDLGAEHFDERLLREIERTPKLVIVLAPGSLDRCRREDDWLRREIIHALKHGKNVVPLLADGFHFPAANVLPVELQSLQRLNGVVYSHEYFNAAFDKLEGFLRNV